MSQLDFCKVLYVGLSLNRVLKLQLPQLPSILTGTVNLDHIYPVLKELHCLPVRFWAQFKGMALTFKGLNGLGLWYLKQYLLPFHPACILRLSAKALPSAPLSHCPCWMWSRRTPKRGPLHIWHPLYGISSLGWLCFYFRCQTKLFLLFHRL